MRKVSYYKVSTLLHIWSKVDAHLWKSKQPDIMQENMYCIRKYQDYNRIRKND